MRFNVTLVQVSCKEGRREENFNRVRNLLEQKAPMDGISFIVLPELFAIGFRHKDYEQEGPGIPGPTNDFICEIARNYDSYVVGTGIEEGGSMFYNTLAIADPTGKALGIYRKIHPFQEEREIFKGGDKVVLFKAKGIKVGVEICYDIRFPEVTRKLALEGAQLVLIPAAFPDPRSVHWDTLVMARAIENQLYMAAANRVGFSFDGKTYFGHSQLVDPWGIRTTRVNSQEQIFTGVGDTNSIESVRQKITCYSDRSPTGYDQVEWLNE